MRRVTLLRRCRGVAIVMALAACAPAPKEEGQRPVWPPPPDPARIAYVKTFSSPVHLGIERGFLGRLSDLLFGGSEARLVRPMAVMEAGGVVFVADPGAKGVHRFDPGNGQYDLVQAEGGLPLESPVGLARGAASEIYVADSSLARIFVISPGAKTAAPLALAATLAQPTGIATDPATGRLFVVDTTAHRVLTFGPDGSLLASLGRRGIADGEFNYPTYLWRDPKGQLYVTDTLNFRVQIFDEQGRFVRKFGRLGDGTGDSARQKGVATDRFGHVYIVDSLFHAFQVFDPSGRFLLSVGEQGTGRAEFWLPTGIFIGADDMIFVVDSYNRRVQVFRYIGGPT